MKDFPNCKDCTLRDRNYVPSEGLRGAKIVIIGGAPRVNEEKDGKPFIGGAGNILTRSLLQAGILRKDAYITNVLKCRPPQNNIKSVYAIEAYKRCQPILIQELANLNHLVIMPMGNTVLQSLGYNYKISQARGFILESDFGKVK
jgi:DNA polymerase